MRISDPKDVEALSALGSEAAASLIRGDIRALADRYGYMLAHGREVEAAIRSDLAQCLADLGGAHVHADAQCSQPKVGFFEPTSTQLVALVECIIPTDVGSGVLLELVVIGNGVEHHLYLEDIGPADHPAFA